jgi:hypothetical protein
MSKSYVTTRVTGVLGAGEFSAFAKSVALATKTVYEGNERVTKGGGSKMHFGNDGVPFGPCAKGRPRRPRRKKSTAKINTDRTRRGQQSIMFTLLF